MHDSMAAVALVGLVVAVFTPGSGNAQAYPTKPIRFISGQAGGGVTDAYFRMLTEGMAQTLGQPIITENKPGANNYIAQDAVAKAPPDGYTIGNGQSASLVIGPLLRAAPFDPVKSFTHIGQVFELPLVLAVRTGMQITSVKELIAFARANPGKLNFGSNGIGSTGQLGLELMKMKYGVEIEHIPYKDDVGVIQAIKSNDVDTIMYSPATVLLLQRQGAVRMLATLGPNRDAKVPDVPTAAEAGVPDLIMRAWVSVIGPAGMPRDIVERLNRTMNDQLARPEIAAKGAAMLATPKTGSPEDALNLLRNDIATFKEVIERAKIKVD